jgi:hypothetical protein
MRHRLLGALSLAALATALAAEAQQTGIARTTAKFERVVSETLVARLPTGTLARRVFASPDARHVAYVAAVPGGYRMYLDGKEGPGPYTGVSDPTFSPNSVRLAYAAVIGDRSTLVMDGVEGPWYDGISSFKFSPDSARTACAARTRMLAPVWLKWQVVIDNNASPAFETFTDPVITFSPDSTRIAYHYSVTRGRDVTVLDGQRLLPDYDAVGVIFIPSSQELAYEVRKGTDSFVLVNGRVVAGPHRRIEYVSFSSDGRRMAYTVFEVGCGGGCASVVVDGTVGPRYWAVGAPVVFSPDGRRWGYTARRSLEDAGIVVVDGREYAEATGLIFSPDSRRIATFRVSSSLLSGMSYRVIVDGQEGGRYDYIQGFTFSPDSLHFAYAARRGKNSLVVIDGRDGKEHRQPEYSSTELLPSFSPDSHHVVYMAPIGSLHTVMVDDIEGGLYDEVLRQAPWQTNTSRIVFDSPTRFHYLARKGNALYLIHEELR